MAKKQNVHQRQSMVSSFKHAFLGIAVGIIKERNMKIHVCAMCLVILFGIGLKISLIEWCICISLCGMVIGAELINCAVEAIMDMVMPDIHPKAKVAKDTAAGAVLVCAISALIVGGIIFIPKMLHIVSFVVK